MATINFTGLATGLDVNGIIDALVAVERRSITLLERQKSSIQTKVDLYQQLSGKFAALETATTRLSTEADFYVKQAASSNETILVATAGSNAEAANHTVTVDTLARATTLASAPFDDTDTTTVGTGTLRITVGTTVTDIPIDSNNNTLAGLRDAINGSGADVTASIVTVDADATPSYRLVVSGKSTGLANAVTIDASGLSGGTPLGFTVTQPAQDATLTVDGISVTRAANVVSDVIPGVTLDLKSAAPGTEVQVTVSYDIEAIEQQVNDFIAAYNDIMTFVHEQTKFDSVTRQGGPLIGDSTLRTLRRNLQSMITTPVAGTPSILADIGVATEKDGTLSVDASKLENALKTDLSGVANIFLDPSDGLAQSVLDFAELATRLGDGILTARIDGAGEAIAQIDDRIAEKKDELERFEQDLIRKFTVLETLVSQINAQGNYLVQQLASLGAQLGTSE
ncbi:MAG TPA: flagellar filament capping protein FliD [candidate division Zixibacteria bacterium]|nr:flagellar filament capping protein FliD [candidate division Zixibacteria bacterium]